MEDNRVKKSSKLKLLNSNMQSCCCVNLGIDVGNSDHVTYKTWTSKLQC